MFARYVNVSGITIGPHVDQLVTSTLSQADSNIIKQFCRHNWELKTAVRIIIGNTNYVSSSGTTDS